MTVLTTRDAQLAIGSWAADRAWWFAGSAVTVRRPGDVLTSWAGAEPAVVVGQPEGGVLAFVNRCIHANIPFCRDGHVDDGVLLCNAHGWRFDLAGRLLDLEMHAVASQGSRSGPSMMHAWVGRGLAPLRVAMRGPWLFVSFEGDAEDLERCVVPESADELRPAGRIVTYTRWLRAVDFLMQVSEEEGGHWVAPSFVTLPRSGIACSVRPTKAGGAAVDVWCFPGLDDGVEAIERARAIVDLRGGYDIDGPFRTHRLDEWVAGLTAAEAGRIGT